MSTPPAVCLDTQVFHSLNYNFASPVMQEFVKLCKERKLKLLLPAPIRDEIQRQMVERAKELEAALDKVVHDAQRKCSFLQDWERFPKEPEKKLVEANLHARCQHAWGLFARQLNLLVLRYEGVNLDSIMAKYHHVRPPFGPGDKRKEFPDAISLAILDAYARKHSTTVAVVSGDNGMKAGCESHHLLHFPTLPKLIETILSEDKRVELYLNVINANMYSIESALDEEVTQWCAFSHDDTQYSKGQDRIGEVEVGSFDIIGLGVDECTIAFSAA